MVIVAADGRRNVPEECTSDFAWQMRPWVKAIVTVHFLLGIARFLFLDIWGGLVLILVGVCGIFIFTPERGFDPYPPMQLRSLNMWGLLCFFQLFMESLIATAKLVHFMNGTSPQKRTWDGQKVTTTEGPPKQGGWDGATNYERAQIILVLSVPVVMLISSWFAYVIYLDYWEHKEARGGRLEDYLTFAQPPVAPAGPPPQERARQAAEARAASGGGGGGSQAQPPAAAPFRGRAHRIDDVEQGDRRSGQ
mmetsp:Transcript_33602/g.81267  ORF Transcript_33602/g.81267 Transcript_33602/m.81267 type:complete len:250 (+) Transcript_33602:123-872(+)